MTKFESILGPQVVTNDQLTVGRFYQVIDADGDHMVVKAIESQTASFWGKVVEVVQGDGYRVGHEVLLSARLRGAIDGKIYKFKERPEILKHRGKRVTSTKELTIGRWYVCEDEKGIWHGQLVAKRGQQAKFMIDESDCRPKVANGRKVPVFLWDTDNGGRKIYKFKQHLATKAKKPAPTVQNPPKHFGFSEGERVTYVAVDKHAMSGLVGRHGTVVAPRNQQVGVHVVWEATDDKPQAYHCHCAHYISRILDDQPTPDAVTQDPELGAAVKQVHINQKLAIAARAAGLLGNEAQRLYDIAWKAAEEHSKAHAAWQQSLKDLDNLTRELMKDEPFNSAE